MIVSFSFSHSLCRHLSLAQRQVASWMHIKHLFRPAQRKLDENIANLLEIPEILFWDALIIFNSMRLNDSCLQETACCVLCTRIVFEFIKTNHVYDCCLWTERRISDTIHMTIYDEWWPILWCDRTSHTPWIMTTRWYTDGNTQRIYWSSSSQSCKEKRIICLNWAKYVMNNDFFFSSLSKLITHHERSRDSV